MTKNDTFNYPNFSMLIRNSNLKKNPRRLGRKWNSNNR